MPSPTFNRSMNELKDKGFIEVSDPGGIFNGKGRPAQFYLSDIWKKWIPTPHNSINIDKARAARKKGRKHTLAIDISEIRNQNPT
jgi:hypothetical protein